MTNDAYISTTRLFAAADALMDAINSPEGMNTLIDMTVLPGVKTAATQHLFTENELVEAMALLIRLGLVGPVAPAA